jgi:hypothetical protein
VGQRTRFSFARVIEILISDGANGRATGKIASDPAKPLRKRRRSSITNFI